jgi:apolipoprotein N-acyltransferase
MGRSWIFYGVPVGCGLLLGLCFPSAHWYFLAWGALAPLVYLTAQAPCPKRAALQWFIAGWVFHSFVLQWLMANIFWAGGWAVVGYQLMVLALSVFWALLGGSWFVLLRRAPHLGAPLFAGLFLCVEWIHANTFSGFGWCALVHSQGPDLALMQWAAIGGTALVALPIAYGNAALGLFFAGTAWRWQHLGAAVALAVAMHVGGALMLGSPDYQTQPLRAGVFQSNYTNEMKWDGEFTIDMVERAARHSTALEEFQPVDLMVWPEALVMYHFEREELLERLRGYAVDNDTALFTGTVRHEGNNSFNSSVLISKAGEVAGVYDKVHLVPFGEYVPFEEWLPFVKQVVQSNVAAGDAQHVLESDGVKVGPLICFEVLYAPMAAKLRGLDARTLAVVTNLAWFGSSSAIAQEIEIARVRAIETRLPLVHASNTGVSGVFDPWGRFEGVDSWATFDGRLSQREGTGDPMALAHRRALGAFDVAAPAQQPLPGGPVYVPMVFLLLTALLAGLAYLPKRLGKVGVVGGAAQGPEKQGVFPPPPPDDISI